MPQSALIPERYSSALSEQFGLQALRPIQQRVLAAVAEGAHVLAVLPTGAGKSLCFQLPAAVGGGLTLCISPLIALMRDQVMSLRRRGIGWAGAAHSLQTEQETDRVYAAVRDGRCRLLYVAPERLRSRRFWAVLQERGAERFVIDEAHCLSAWGHDFRADYRLLPSLWDGLGRPQVLAFTATASAEVRADLRDAFPGLEPILAPINRPGLRLSIREVGFYGPRLCALWRMCGRETPAIVYSASRRDVEAIAASLNKAGIEATAYHAGLPGECRNAAQKAFQEDKLKVIVATTAFGMGVDKRDIRQVIHAGVPFGVEYYWQEVGRAGRDGNPASATVLWSEEALERTRRIIESETPSPDYFRCAWKAAEAAPGLNRGDFEKALLRYLRESRLPALSDNAMPALLGPLYHAEALVVDGSGGHHPGPKSAWKAALQIAERRQHLRNHSIDALVAMAESRRCRVLSVADFLGLPAEPCRICDTCRAARR